MKHGFISKDRHRICNLNRGLLRRLAQIRDALGEIERSLQQKHLSCCIFPQVQGSTELAVALDQLRLKRFGALIAIEQKISLEDYGQTGTFLRARLSAPLLLSVFYPGNPLHDGAVVIRGNAVLAAGCVLPLSADHTRFRIRGLGMRHRAGVGLSQVSDAVVFIVSEESGNVSVARSGQLYTLSPSENGEELDRIDEVSPPLENTAGADGISETKIWIR